MKIAFLYDPLAFGAHRPPFDFRDIESYGLTGTDLIAVAPARELALRGHDVALYIDRVNASEFDGVQVREWAKLGTEADRYDAFYAVSNPNALGRVPASAVRLVNRQVARFSDCDCTKDFDSFVDVYTCPSQVAADFVSAGMPHPDKFRVLPNGCYPEQFGDVERVPGRCVYISSPDRGLHLLLEAWPHIRRAVPESTLKVFYYSLDSWLAEHTRPRAYAGRVDEECARRAAYIQYAMARLAPHGVERVGGVSHRDLQRELSAASALTYPCDTLAFTETFSVATLEACAAGAAPIIFPADALGSIYDGVAAVPAARTVKAFADETIAVLRDGAWTHERAAKAKAFAAAHAWAVLAEKLEGILYEAAKVKGGRVPEVATLPCIGAVRSRPVLHMVLSEYGSGGVVMDPTSSAGDAFGGGSRAGFCGLAAAMGRRGDYDIRAFSSFETGRLASVEHAGVSYHPLASLPRQAKPDALLAYYDCAPLKGVHGCLRIASHHTLNIPWGGLSEWTDVNVAPSAYAVEKLRCVYDESAPWYVLPNGVGDLPPRRPVPGRVIYHTSPSRGLHLLLRWWPEIRQLVPSVTLRVIGDVDRWADQISPHSRQGERATEIRALSNQADVTMLGSLPRADVLRELAEASVFAFPASVVAPCETFSVSIMECCRMGLPVATSPVDALPSIYGGHVAMTRGSAETSRREFVETVADILTEPMVSAMWSKRGRALAESFTFDAQADVLAGILGAHLPARALDRAAE